MLKFWVFMIFLAVVSVWDGKTKKIPNWLIVGGATVGILFGGAGMAWNEMGEVPGIVPGAALAALRMFTAVLPGLALYRFRIVGAGDVKLAAVIVGFMGYGAGGAGILAGLCLGAVWALVRMVRRGIMRRRFCYLIGYVRRVLLTGEIEAYYDRSRDGEEAVIPLGVCLAVGAAAVAVVWCLRAAGV